MMATNDRQDAVDKHVSNLDVNHIQAQAPEVSDSSKLTLKMGFFSKNILAIIFDTTLFSTSLFYIKKVTST